MKEIINGKCGKVKPPDVFRGLLRL